MIPQYKTIIARQLRKDQTDVEKLLWFRLKNKQLGVKFRRQQVVGCFIVDFICFEHNLIIELDGGQHNEKVNTAKDQDRTKWLLSEGYFVIRFWNNDIIENIDGVLAKVQETLTLTLSPNGRGN